MKGEEATTERNNDFDEGVYKGCMFHTIYMMEKLTSNLGDDAEHLHNMGIEIFKDGEIDQIIGCMNMLHDKLKLLVNAGSSLEKKENSDEEYRIEEDEDDCSVEPRIIIGIRKRT